MDFNWDDPDDDLNIPAAGPSFVERARNAPDDDDDDIRLWGGGADAPAIIPQDTAEETSLQKLIRYWMNERHAPDILPAQEMLLGRLLDHIRKQVRFLSTDGCYRVLITCSLCSQTTCNYCGQTQTRLKMSTFGLCWYRRRSNASSLSFGRICGRVCTRYVTQLCTVLFWVHVEALCRLRSTRSI